MGSVYREINVGRITGLSSYELAVRDGKFEGTEEEFINKEMEMYEEMKETKEDFDSEVASIRNVIPTIGTRMNFLGFISEKLIIDTIFDTYRTDDAVVKDRHGAFSYTFNYTYGMIIGVERDLKHGVQARLSWSDGFDIRYKNNSETWGEWESGVFHNIVGQ